MKSSIEEAIERLEKGMSDICFSVTYSKEEEEEDLKILLTDYKIVLKENKELKEENKMWQKYKEELDKLDAENFILKDEVKEILDKTEITDFNELVEMYLEIKKLLGNGGKQC